jgi:hypothetical protein
LTKPNNGYIIKVIEERHVNIVEIPVLWSSENDSKPHVILK